MLSALLMAPIPEIISECLGVSQARRFGCLIHFPITLWHAQHHPETAIAGAASQSRQSEKGRFCSLETIQEGAV